MQRDVLFREFAFAEYAPASGECLVDQVPFGPSFAVPVVTTQEHRFDPETGSRGAVYGMGSETEFFDDWRTPVTARSMSRMHVSCIGLHRKKLLPTIFYVGPSTAVLAIS